MATWVHSSLGVFNRNLSEVYLIFPCHFNPHSIIGLSAAGFTSTCPAISVTMCIAIGAIQWSCPDLKAVCTLLSAPHLLCLSSFSRASCLSSYFGLCCSVPECLSPALSPLLLSAHSRLPQLILLGVENKKFKAVHDVSKVRVKPDPTTV